MRLDVSFQALPTWPHDRTPDRERRSRWTFKASWQNTLDLLGCELSHLGATSVLIGAGFKEGDIRLDGMPRASASMPLHPGIELSFDTKQHGRLVYATDVCDFWQHNVRSIALGLEALRAVDRYGISRRGQQYTGWKELPTGMPIRMTREEAAGFLAFHAGLTEDRESSLLSGDVALVHTAFKLAAQVLHPDRDTGSVEGFQRLQQAKFMLLPKELARA